MGKGKVSWGWGVRCACSPRRPLQESFSAKKIKSFEEGL
jgi:hypothetical protein